MTVDPAVIPGLLLLAAELGVLAAVGYVVVRVALRQNDERVALAQGLVVGLALWGLITNFVLYAVPGMAGAAVGWGVTLVLGGVLAWRAPHSIWPHPRVAAGFMGAVLALFWMALASRQLLTIPDAANHLGLAASIRAGGFPPELPWNPGMAAPYHYGIDLLIGLLAPPVGPDLAFVTELLGAYAWTSFVLVVITGLLRRASGFAVLATVPLLLTAGAWTLVFAPPPYVLQLPVPEGIPTAGIRASLADIYWPSLGQSGALVRTVLHDIWTPAFTLGYALAFVVLAHAARAGRRSRLEALTLAGLVGFVGLLASTLAPVLLVMWTGLEGLNFLHSRRAGSVPRAAMLWSGAGLALAALLLVVGGGRLTGILDGQVGSGLSFEGIRDLGSRRLLGSFDPRSGGVGVLGIGPVLVAGVAALLARRDRLVLALAMGAGALLLARLVLSYEPRQADLTRLDGHARNLALLALLLALSACLTGLRPARWRYAAGGLLVTLITWPTVAEPVRNLGQAIGHGVVVANAQAAPREPDKRFQARFRLGPPPADGVAAYVRNQTAVDARVLSPHAARLTFATGRPNASGFAEHLHLFAMAGPGYLDAIHYLEPAALRRLGIAYVHATDAWVVGLPDRAARWLANPGFFELLVRDGAEALYRVRPEFLRLDAPPVPASFEALRQAVPASTAVYLPPVFGSLPMLRVAASLPHARLLGYVDPAEVHVLTSIPIEPLSRNRPDVVVTPTQLVPWMLPPGAGRQPIWWNDEVAVYAPNGAVAPIMSPPPAREEPLAVSVRVSDVRAAAGRIAFTATFDNSAPEQWTGQDWVVIAVDASPWVLPLGFQPDSRTPVAAAWFGGWLGPSAGTTTHTYEFDALASRLAVEDGNGEFTVATGSGRIEGAGAWLLAIRLRHEYRPNHWRDAALIPVLRIMVSEAGEVSYQVYADPLAAQPLP